MPAKIALVSCVKSKRSEQVPHQAQELYVSQLFAGMRRYAEQHADRWYILSAKYGLLTPTQPTMPYEMTLATMTAEQRATWGRVVSHDLRSILDPGDEVLMLTGKLYRDPLAQFLQHHGVRVTIPMQGLMFGQQLQWLKRANVG